ncbi:hypothetical protein RF11_08383 [Thelohanellus kitauei]|uniref:Tc1-like transposase DDE domain-containing protein n=1 Tax=Thelohanellus kitauei TaxID=669202 RepID=A0A0C2IPZ4_THEKT|nr:hypothetical protein RF11_08383 [Thelohanellus kitauei]
MNFEKVEIMRSMIRRGATTKEIATDLNISESSAPNYKRKIEEGQSVLIFPKRKKENRQREELSSMINRIVSNNNSVTLGGIQSHRQEQGITRSVPSISKMLKEEFFTRKRLQKVPLERNSHGNLDLRQNYCRILFIDETGINLHTNIHYGYSPAGLTATISEPANKGVNISVLVAIALTGVVHYMIVDGAIDGELFRDFMTQLGRMNSNVSNVYVMDNARIHKSRVVSAYLQESNMRVEFLPPYSP